MRVLLDTNVFVSYLLSPDRGGTITTVDDAALSGRYSLLVPQEQFDKLFEVLTTKPYIASRVSQHVAVQFVDSLRAIAVLPPIIDEAIPTVVRDPKDDYLLAYALVGRADYLVAGDDDLLSLGAFTDFEIVSPPRLVELLG